MDREFRSQVGWWYHLLLVIITIGCVAAFLQASIWPIIGMVVVTMLTIHIFLNTWYRITADGLLIVHCSIFPEKSIPISEIEMLEPTMMPVWSYALSLDRILIWANGKPWMMLSPRNKKEFVRLLQEKNPAIRWKKEETFL